MNGPANRDGRIMQDVGAGATRTKRGVWSLATAPFKGAHFAVFPPALVEPCILAGTSPKVCSRCGEPYRRKKGQTEHGSNCSCNASATAAVVLDPFAGSGTTGAVAIKHGRSAILCELNPQYAEELIPKRVEKIAGKKLRS